MLFYITNIFIFLFFGFLLSLKSKNKIRNNKLLLGIFLVQFGAIMALRSENVGTDVKMYSGLFKQIYYSYSISYAFNIIKSAPLYILYNRIVSIFAKDNSQWIIFFNSLIIIIGIGLFIYRNSKNVIMSIYFYITLYFYFTSFNISRQFIAVVLVANSYYYIKKNKNFKFLILIFFATLIHNTAIVGLVLFPLNKIKWTNMKICVLTIIITAFMFLYTKLLNIFLAIFPRYLMYINGNSQFSISDTGQGRKIIVLFFYLLIVVACMIFLYKTKKQDKFLYQKKELYVLTTIIIIATISGIIFYNNLLISRAEIYFSIFIIIYIPNFIEVATKKWSKILSYYCLFFITFIPMIVQLKDNISGVIPYNFFWN